MTLRKQPQAEVLAKYLKADSLQRVLKSNSPANRILLISYTFISLDCLAEELEDPFGIENNDLPLDAICNLLLQHLMVAFKKMLLFALGQILQPWT